eukprot:5241964-Prymnesium_polylepis.1
MAKAQAAPSFIESPFPARKGYEAYLRLPAAEREVAWATAVGTAAVTLSRQSESADVSMAAAPMPRAPIANEVLSAHSTIATLVTTSGGTAVFGVKHYLRYAILSRTQGDGPQKEWRSAIDQADDQIAQYAEEAEGSISAVIRSLDIGCTVALDWIQVAERVNGRERIEYPCQGLERISPAKERRLLAAQPEVMQPPLHPPAPARHSI